MRKHTVVVGAGLGGLSASIALAARGQRVTVVETLDRPGGKMGELRADGFRWDTGPSVITMRDVFERLFELAGRRLADFVTLVALDPVTRYFWRDGLRLDAVTDLDAMCAQIARFSPQDATAYRAFLAHSAQLFDTVKAPFLYRRKPGLRDLIKLPVRDALKIDAFRSMHTSVAAAFQDKHLIQLFDRFATYNGSSPYRVPATLNTIAHVEMTAGAYYPRGGVFQLARAFEQLARELGVEILYRTGARSVLAERGRITGIATDAGVLKADAVVCNVDFTHAQVHLLGRQPSGRLEPSCSGFAILLGVRGTFSDLAHHTLFFSDDYPREFADIFDKRVPTPDPTLYVCVTSKTDPTHAPAGCENWFVLVNTPYLTANFDWERDGARYAEDVLQLLCSRTGLSEDQIVSRHMITPHDLQTMYGGNRGAIYGFSSNTMTAAFMRPSNRDKKLRGLYYASGSAHPGGGAPLVTLSGMAAAECVLEDQHM
jgi:phytoene desaturase